MNNKIFKRLLITDLRKKLGFNELEKLGKVLLVLLPLLLSEENTDFKIFGRTESELLDGVLLLCEENTDF